MGSQSYKIVLNLTDKALPVLFRDVAALLEGGSAYLLKEVILQDIAKMKIETKQEGSNVQVKIKIEHIKTNGGSESKTVKAKTLKYSHIKKELKSIWGSIRRSVHAGQIPDPEDVADFMNLSQAMISYPGYGDVFYKPYKEALESFQQNCASGDKESLRKVCNNIDRIKESCHDIYK